MADHVPSPALLCHVSWSLHMHTIVIVLLPSSSPACLLTWLSWRSAVMALLELLGVLAFHFLASFFHAHFTA